MSAIPPAGDRQMEKPAPDLADVPYGPHARQRVDFWRSRGGEPFAFIWLRADG